MTMTPDDITALVQSGALTHQQAIDVFAALYGRTLDASALQLPCEDCGTLTPLTHVVSYKVWTPMPGPGVIGEDEQHQHFGCSHDCAERAAIHCLQTHLRPEAERRVAAAVAAQSPAEAPAFQPGPDGALSADVPEPEPEPTEMPATPAPTQATTQAPTQGEGVPGI